MKRYFEHAEADIHLLMSNENTTISNRQHIFTAQCYRALCMLLICGIKLRLKYISVGIPRQNIPSSGNL